MAVVINVDFPQVNRAENVNWDFVNDKAKEKISMATYKMLINTMAKVSSKEQQQKSPNELLGCEVGLLDEVRILQIVKFINENPL